MKRWKVALIGCGSIAGEVYLPQIQRVPEAEVVAVCDILPDRARLYADRFHVPACYFSIEELLEKCDFEILMNTTSIPAHHEINMLALNAGKHLYSQKPVGLTVEEVTAQIEAAKKSGVKFSASPIHMLRNDIRFAQKLIAEGGIGEITKVRAISCHGGPEYFQYREADPTWFFRAGSGALYDMGVHAFHMLTGIMGPARALSCMAKTSMPERTVRSGAFHGLPIKADELMDNYVVTLDYGARALAVVETGYCELASRTPNFSIYGTKGVISFKYEPDNPVPLDVYIDAPERGIRGWVSPMLWNDRPDPFFQCLAVRDLIQAIEMERPVGLPPEQARHVVDIMCTIPIAVKERRTVDLTTTF